MRWIAAVVVAVLCAPALASGAVVSSMSGRTLTLTGDEAANSFVITSGGDTDALTVTPTNGTTLDGGAGAVVFTRVRSLTISTGAGDDRVDLQRISLRGTARIRLGDGNDTAFFTSTSIRGRVAVRGEAGTDTIRTETNAIFFGGFVVKGEGENDELQCVSTQFRNRVKLNAGSGDDHVLVQSVVAGEFARVEVFCATGLDFLEVLTSQLGNDTLVDMGADNDRARIVSSKFTLDLSCFGGPGAGDVLSLEGVNTFSRRKVFDGFEEGEP